MQKPELPKFPEFPGKGLRNEILKVILLHRLECHSEYPYEMLKAMRERKVWIFQGLTKNDLYNAMSSLEKQGFIRSKVVMKGGKVQKHYELTPRGKKIVKNSRKIMLRSFLEVKKMINEEV